MDIKEARRLKHNESQRRYEESHPEYQKDWKRKNKDSLNEKRRKYYSENKEYHRKYRLEHADKVREYARKAYQKSKDKKRESQRVLRKKYKDTFLEMYGGKCTCCGETIYEFLTIEHKKGQEKVGRRTGMVAYRDAIKEFRPDLYEVLCWNCNCAKGHLGYCPHHPPATIQPYKIHRSDKPYKYSKPVDSLGRRYGS